MIKRSIMYMLVALGVMFLVMGVLRFFHHQLDFASFTVGIVGFSLCEGLYSVIGRRQTTTCTQATDCGSENCCQENTTTTVPPTNQ